uniref:Ribosomal protein S3 n=1 Tax=Plocamiocolax pulvinatus TaxID=35206 RepID=E5Q3E9_9FLOR|nr:ribosomal protein S3 [Plocamiocolax pulvinata]ADR03232.1 ribosomal protein S3 [Plocamiocolax pulvinata]
MAKKINPISLRLGIIQVWNFLLQNYDREFNNYAIILHKYLQLKLFLKLFFSKYKFFISHMDFWCYHHFIFLNIYYTNIDFLVKKKFIKYLLNIVNIIKKKFLLKIKIRLYYKIEYFSTVHLISNYFCYLLEKNFSFSKILWVLMRFLEKNLNTYKIMYSKNGPIKMVLKGFKIKLVGRFKNTRNPMAKSVEYNVGSLSLISLKNQVEFSKTEVMTKLGVCGLHIWLFYEVLNFYE